MVGNATLRIVYPPDVLDQAGRDNKTVTSLRIAFDFSHAFTEVDSSISSFAVRILADDVEVASVSALPANLLFFQETLGAALAAGTIIIAEVVATNMVGLSSTVLAQQTFLLDQISLDTPWFADGDAQPLAVPAISDVEGSDVDG